MKRLMSTVIALAFMIHPATAQFHDAGNVRAEINASAGIPQGEFDRHLDGEAVGLSTFIGGPVPRSPIVLGSEFGFLNYGTDSQLRLHETVFDAGVGNDLAVPVEAVATSVSNNILLGHLVVRLQPLHGAFQPYVDLVGGWKYFMTRLRVDGDLIVFRRGLSQDAHVTDFAFSYGVGGGFELRLYEHTSVWSAKPANVSLHGGLRYLFGTDASYAVEGSMREIGDRIVVDEVESRTDMIVPQLGVRVSH